MKVTNETKVGVFAAIAITLLVLGYNYIRGSDIFQTKTKIYAVYEQVNGLTRSNPVIYYGYKVGTVDDIQIEQVRPPKILVQLSIRQEIQIPKGSTAEIVNADFLGSKAIEIIPSNKKIYVESRDTLKTSVAMGLVETVNKTLEPLRDKVDTAVTALNRILSNAPIESFESSFRSISRSVHNLENTTSTIDTVVQTETKTLTRILANLDRITTTLDQRTVPKIDSTMGSVKQLSDSLSRLELASTLRKAEATLSSLEKTLRGLEEGEGSLGLLLKDEDLYYNLNNTVRDLDRLILDIQNRPGRYVKFPLVDFGGSDEEGAKEAEEYMEKRDQQR